MAYSRAELQAKIEEIEDGKHTIENVVKLAGLYTVSDHLYPTDIPSYSTESRVETITESVLDRYGDTDFLTAIDGQRAEDILLIVDDLMTTLAVLNPKLYNAVMQKIKY